MSFEILKYTNEYKRSWDEFIYNHSINGTFLQSREFLEYHPKERFMDCSIIFKKNNKLVAVCPACEIEEGGKKVFFSHKGSTYGGIVVCNEIYNANDLFQLLNEFEEYLRLNGFGKVVFKMTSELLVKRPMDLIDYYMYYFGYIGTKDLNLYVDYRSLKVNDLTCMLSKMKRRNVKKCIAEGCSFSELTDYNRIKEFYEVLCKNLIKYKTRPVHTLEELYDLKYNRFPERIKFYGVFYKEKIIAGSMVFEFGEHDCIHTQYLASDSDYNHLNAMSYLYYGLMVKYYNTKINKISWGITTEDSGKILNFGLVQHKEGFGSNYSVNSIYEKVLL